ncbi:MAG: nitric oxide reductase activation protein NorD [Nitrospirales bacterium]
MKSSSSHDFALLDLLLDRHDPAMARKLSDDLGQYGIADTVLELLQELQDASSKIASEAVWTLEEYHRRCELDTLIPWLDLGISLTQTKGALGLRYFKESPLVLGVLDSSAQRLSLLQLILELADGPADVAPNCAFEFFKKAPELLLEIPIEELIPWAEAGMELAEWDYVLGNEFFRESPSIAHAIPHDQVRDWIGFGMKLVTKNSLGNTDYVGTIEFFRSSPSILNAIADGEVKKWIVQLGTALAERSPELAISFLADSSQLLQKMPTIDWRLRVLKYGLLLADRDAESTLAYLNRASQIVQLTGTSEDAVTVFEDWYRSGMEILEYSPEGARAYFSLETRNAMAAVEKSMQGVPLRQVARTLKLFAQGMCGEDIAIEALPESMPLSNSTGEEGTHCRAKVSVDGQTIFLPTLIRQASRDKNMRLYTVMTAHEAGHLEFGTYRVAIAQLRSMAEAVHQRYSQGSGPVSHSELNTLGELFDLYPQRGVVQDLWEILEDARVEYLLQQEYPGLRQDLASLSREAVKTRSFLHGMTVREIVLDGLLLRFAGEPSGIGEQRDLQDIVARTWDLAQTILHPDATAEDVIVLADQIYQVLDEMIATLTKADGRELQEKDAEEFSDLGAGPRAAEEVAGEYRPITNLAYRGAMDPDMVQGQGDDDSGHSSAPDQSLEKYEGDLDDGVRSFQPGPTDQTSRKDDDYHEPGQSQQEYGQSPLEQWLDIEGGQRSSQRATPDGPQQVLYDEWDGSLKDYRPRWCRVIEQLGKEGNSEFVDQTLAAYAPEVRLLRRYFETIRPTALRRLGRQEGGEDIDIDAVVGRVVDKRVGQEPSDRVYLRRERYDRQVAVAFLIDMSGSTGRQLGSGPKRVIDIEKEGLILLSEALSAIGDEYALYGYSGQGRGQVDITVLKDFDDVSLSRTALRIGAIAPMKQNRDGAAIRHAAHRLLQQPARTRLLVVISDGKPLDDGYGDEYSLEDTKMALRESRMKGIHPFCITVDQTAGDYLTRMYGDVGFVVVDDVAGLPLRLPKIYQRLTT